MRDTVNSSIMEVLRTQGGQGWEYPLEEYIQWILKEKLDLPDLCTYL